MLNRNNGRDVDRDGGYAVEKNPQASKRDDEDTPHSFNFHSDPTAAPRVAERVVARYGGATPDFKDQARGDNRAASIIAEQVTAQDEDTPRSLNFHNNHTAARVAERVVARYGGATPDFKDQARSDNRAASCIAERVTAQDDGTPLFKNEAQTRSNDSTTQLVLVNDVQRVPSCNSASDEQDAVIVVENAHAIQGNVRENEILPPSLGPPTKRKMVTKVAIIVGAILLLLAIIIGGVVGGLSGAGTSPSSTPVSSSEVSRATNIAKFVNDITFLEEAITYPLTSTTPTPEQEALKWLIEDDPLQLSIDADMGKFRLMQRYALATLWFSTTRTTWTKSDQWLTVASECTWFGITCASADVGLPQETEAVSEISFDNDDLSGNNLRGTIPADVGLLSPSLTLLDLSHNRLFGSLAPALGHLTNLKELWLCCNEKLNGPLPTTLQRLTNLKFFEVSENALTGLIPYYISNWNLLVEAYFDANQFSGALPSDIGQLTNLEFFRVDTNALTGILPNSIGQMTALEYLWMSSNFFSGTLPNSIGKMTNLRQFYVWNNTLSGPLPASIGSLTNLVEISVQTNWLTGTIPRAIENWVQIEIAYFYENLLTGTMPSGICTASNLTSLIADCAVSCTCCAPCWE